MWLSHLFAICFYLFPFAITAQEWQPGDECPETIKATVTDTDGGLRLKQFPTMQSVHSALITCPNITGLDLQRALGGCVVTSEPWNFPFKQSSGDRYPPLKELRLKGYNFHERPMETTRHGAGSNAIERWADWVLRGNAMRYLQYSLLNKSKRTKSNLELWLDAMDWSKLESFAWTGDASQFPARVFSELASLTSLEITNDDDVDIAEALRDLANDSLTNLTYISRTLPPLARVLELQGGFLESLTIRSPERMCSETPLYNGSELALLSAASRLTHLGVNVDRNGTWPWETLGLLASIPSLRSLDIWLDITSDCRREMPDAGLHNSCDANKYSRRERDKIHETRAQANITCEGEEHYRTPHVGVEAASEVFQYLRDKKVGEALDNVAFFVGDWEPPWNGPLYFPLWIEGKRASVRCTAQNGVGDKAWCRVEKGEQYWKKDEYWSHWDDMWELEDVMDSAPVNSTEETHE